jgi:hypothetical protein
LELNFESADQDALKQLETTSFERSEEGEYHTQWSEIESKPQAVEGPSSAQSAADSTFTRSVELRLGPHQHSSLWKWFQATTRSEPVPDDPEENAKMDELNEFFAKAEIDRQRVKAGMDDIRKQREDLKKAREAAARMANEE